MNTNILTQGVDAAAGERSESRLAAAATLTAIVAQMGKSFDERRAEIQGLVDRGELAQEDADMQMDALDEAERLSQEQTIGNAAEVLNPDEMRAIHTGEQLEAARETVGRLQKEFIALLPFATEAQFGIVAACAKDEAQNPEGYKVNEDFRLTAEQEVELKNIRKARVAYLATMKTEYLFCMAADEQKLTSYKVRVGAKKTTTTLRFERGMGNAQKKGNGYLAQLRAKLG